MGDAGLLVNPTDAAALAVALTRVITDVPLRARLIAAGTARAHSFSWERCARETLAVLEAVGGRR